VYDPSLGFQQVNDFNPGINPYPDGLFWTLQIPDDSVSVHPGEGGAIYKVSNLQVRDFGDIGSAFNGAPGVPATVSFEVRWSGVEQRLHITDRAAGFAGQFVRGGAQMSWSAVSGDYSYQSDALETSSSDFAETGTERNGVFFPRS
jgi:hypothetical protein